VRDFLLILLVLWCAFSFSLIALLPYNDGFRGTQALGSWEGFVTVFSVVFSGITPGALDKFKLCQNRTFENCHESFPTTGAVLDPDHISSNIAKLMLMLFNFIVVVLLLNSLITIMQDSFNRFKPFLEVLGTVEQAHILADIDLICNRWAVRDRDDRESDSLRRRAFSRVFRSWLRKIVSHLRLRVDFAAAEDESDVANSSTKETKDIRELRERFLDDLSHLISMKEEGVARHRGSDPRGHPWYPTYLHILKPSANPSAKSESNLVENPMTPVQADLGPGSVAAKMQPSLHAETALGLIDQALGDFRFEMQTALRATIREEIHALLPPSRSENAVGMRCSKGNHFAKMSAEEVEAWLQNHGVADMSEHFKAHGITGERLGLLTDSDLKEMGIASSGERKKLMQLLEADVDKPAFDLQATVHAIVRDELRSFWL
jgi:hypothetical protein